MRLSSSNVEIDSLISHYMIEYCIGIIKLSSHICLFKVLNKLYCVTQLQSAVLSYRNVLMSCFVSPPQDLIVLRDGFDILLPKVRLSCSLENMQNHPVAHM